MSTKPPFTPYNTMFKLPVQGVDEGWTDDPEFCGKRDTVLCVSCASSFPLTDLLEAELEENECPTCKVTSDQYWKGRLHRRVP